MSIDELPPDELESWIKVKNLTAGWAAQNLTICFLNHAGSLINIFGLGLSLVSIFEPHCNDLI